ncbi:cysteine desulfurase [Patescibacteria group bacterium]|nr:cysteine desulfurase [Patescibacteria group bacterium]
MFRMFQKRIAHTRRIYLDHAAATPARPEVVAAMMPYLGDVFGNPSAIHSEGRTAKQAVETARASVAKILNIRPEGVIFTSGGTEGNVLAIEGYLAALHESGRSWADMEVVTTAIEHPSVSESLVRLAQRGVNVRTVTVDGDGFISPTALTAVLSYRTVLVTFAYSNSEIGVVQPAHALARAVRAYERAHSGVVIMIHLDAAQAPLWLPCQLPALAVDMLTLDGGKCGGPKGSGVLALRRNVVLVPVLSGGGQERSRRPGTENVPGIVGIAAALVIAQATYKARATRVAEVRDVAIEHLCTTVPGAVLNGPRGSGRVANNINISLPGVDTEYAVVVLDTAGVAASTKSACAGAGGGESVVVQAVTGDAVRARSTIRLTLGEETTVGDFLQVALVLRQHLALMASVEHKN